MNSDIMESLRQALWHLDEAGEELDTAFAAGDHDNGLPKTAIAILRALHQQNTATAELLQALTDNLEEHA